MSRTIDGPPAGSESRTLHRIACGTVVVAMLPVVLGAQTTTEQAGMAFPDWPDSNGVGMFVYKFWLASRDKFLEHSHRLGGVLVGLAAMLLAGAALLTSDRRPVRMLSVACLLAVIAQGVIGGTRVTENNPALAALHGFTAALTVALFGVTACVISRRWAENASVAGPLTKTRWLLAVTALLLCVQYVFGGMMRHNVGWVASAQTSHLHNSFVTFAAVVASGVALIRTRVPWLRASGIALHAVVTGQMLLGLLTWAKKYGAPSFGIVGQPTEPLTNYVRSAHMVLGLILVVTMAVAIARAWRSSSRLAKGEAAPLNETLVTA